MRYFYFNPPVSVKPCESPKISLTARTSTLSIPALTAARTVMTLLKTRPDATADVTAKTK